jgi:hypothetical protein
MKIPLNRGASRPAYSATSSGHARPRFARRIVRDLSAVGALRQFVLARMVRTVRPLNAHEGVPPSEPAAHPAGRAAHASAPAAHTTVAPTTRPAMHSAAASPHSASREYDAIALDRDDGGRVAREASRPRRGGRARAIQRQAQCNDCRQSAHRRALRPLGVAMIETQQPDERATRLNISPRWRMPRKRHKGGPWRNDRESEGGLNRRRFTTSVRPSSP